MHSQANIFSRYVSSHFDEKFKEDGLATSYVEVLICIHENGPLLQREIAEQLQLDPSTITRFVKKLEKEEWIERQKDSGRTKIALTEKKLPAVNRLEKKYEHAVKELKELLGEKYVETTVKLLEHGNSLFENADDR